MSSVIPSLGNNKNDEQFQKLDANFKDTLRDSEIESAGDFYTVATNTESGFKFLITSELFLDSLGPSPAMPTQGENFDYRFSALAPKLAGVNASAFFYPNGGKGYLFFSPSLLEIADHCEVINAQSTAEFCEICRSKIGVEFDYVASAHPGSILD